MVEQCGEGYIGVVPRKMHLVRITVRQSPFGAEVYGFTIDVHRLGQHAVFPFFQVPHEAQPRARAGRLEREGIFVRLERFEAEYLDERTRLFSEMQAGLYHPGIVEYQQTIHRQYLR